ncbi:integrase core domain-containing protein [Paracoccus sp. MC1862]|uniref:integrase core domain-containing protein n=1 Tax=Paracoccus sp. MC1862 TaxID=2760307 RepID=UPI00351C2BD6
MCPTTGRCESFTAKLRDERLTGDILCSLAAAKIVLAAWRRPCTTKRPHSSPGERPPAPEVPQGPPSPPGAWRQDPSCTKIGKGPPQRGWPTRGAAGAACGLDPGHDPVVVGTPRMRACFYPRGDDAFGHHPCRGGSPVQAVPRPPS